MSFNCYFITETIENDIITLEIYLIAKKRVIFLLKGSDFLDKENIKSQIKFGYWLQEIKVTYSMIAS